MLLDTIQVNKKLPTHELYDSLVSKFDFWEASIHINEDYWNTRSPDGSKVMKKFTCEEEDTLKWRKTICSPKSYMNGILQKYLSTSFNNKPVRDENDFYENVDLLGSTIDEFIEFQMENALIYGASYFIPDTTSGEAYTEAQKKQMGVRSFLRSIPPKNVVNWSDLLGHLQEAIMLLEDDDGKIFALYLNHEVKVKINITPKLLVTGIEEAELHGYSMIPLVRMLPFDTEESFVAPGCLSQMSLNNLQSLEKLEIYDNTFTRMFGSGIRQGSEEEMKKLQWGSNRLLMSDDPNAKIITIGADPAQAASIRETIKLEEESLYKQYHISANAMNDTQVASGYSLAISREDFNSVCATIVKSAERAEKQLNILLNDIENITLDDVKYSREFLTQDEKEDILKLRDILSLDLPEEAKEVAKTRYIEKYLTNKG